MSHALLDEARSLAPQIIADRRFLHQHPETGFDLYETVDYVESALREMGYEPKRCGRAGLVATVGSQNPGKVFLVRADMDALPIREEADVPFAATNGRMHACGHDMHAAMLLGAARLLKAHEAEICGTVKLMFQPAEEIFEGARDMIEAGLLTNPAVDAALMIHVMADMPLPTGTVIVSAPGVSAPAADYFTIHVQGKGCHGSMPSAGVDPLNAAAHILISLQELHARELAIDERAVLTIGTMHAGQAANVIPDTVEMGGTIRTYDEETRALLKRRMTEISEGIAAAFQAKATVTFGSGCPTLKNDAALAASTYKYMKELLEPARALSAAEMNARSSASGTHRKSQTGGSEDFAYVSQEVPSLMLALAAGEPQKGYRFPQHHPQVAFDEEVLPVGSAVYAYAAMRWLKDNQ